jgi:hypothetical protein
MPAKLLQFIMPCSSLKNVIHFLYGYSFLEDVLAWFDISLSVALKA